MNIDVSEGGHSVRTVPQPSLVPGSPESVIGAVRPFGVPSILPIADTVLF